MREDAALDRALMLEEKKYCTIRCSVRSIAAAEEKKLAQEERKRQKRKSKNDNGGSGWRGRGKQLKQKSSFLAEENV